MIMLAVSSLSAGHSTGNAYVVCNAYGPAFDDDLFFSQVYYQGEFYEVTGIGSYDYTSATSWYAILFVETDDGSEFIAAAESNGYSDDNHSSPWSIKFCTVYSYDN